MHNGHNGPLITTPYVLPILFFTIWCCFCYLISFISGWFKLSTFFPKQADFYGETVSVGPWFLTIYMRFWGHYSGIVRMTAASNALYLSVLFLFRPGHPPLQIPWSEIQIKRTRYFFRNYIELCLGNETRIPFRISEGAARKLGILSRMGIKPDPEPNFDTLSDEFVESLKKKPE